MNPELSVFAENKVGEVIDNIETMEECGRASKVIDAFEKVCDDRETVKRFREYLCDKTFETYGKIYDKKVNTKVQTSIGEISLV
jgi:lipoate-protein ligase A